VHLPAPGPFLVAPALDEFLEILHRAFHTSAHCAEGVAYLLDAALWLVLHRESHARTVTRQRLEPDGARVRSVTGSASPCDDSVRHLFGDFGVPFLFLAPDFSAPMYVRIVELLDVFHA